jgi:uncharacterized protein (TIGR03086 family)
MELRRALQSTLAVLTKVQPGQLDAPTPCASWDVRTLISHVTGSARWWAGTVAVTGAGADAGDLAEADYAAGDYAAAYAAAYARSSQIALAAFGADGVLDRTVRLPFGEFPGAVVLGMAATEQFTHGWDLARATGQPTDLDPELAAELLGQARLVITDAYRGPDGEALFGPARTAPAGASPADQLAAFLGRGPGILRA